MQWTDVDPRLAALGKDRRWLAEQTGYSYDSLRNLLAPKRAHQITERMLSTMRRAIEDEEARQAEATPELSKAPRELAPGVFNLFRTPEELDRADRASRIVKAPSLVQFCRDVIEAEADRILEDEEKRLKGQNGKSAGAPLYHREAGDLSGSSSSLRVAEPGKDETPTEGPGT